MSVKWGIAVSITTMSLAACNCIPTVLVVHALVR